MIPFHVAAMVVVIVDEFSHSIIEMAFSKDHKFCQAFQFDRLGEPFGNGSYPKVADFILEILEDTL